MTKKLNILLYTIALSCVLFAVSAHAADATVASTGDLCGGDDLSKLFCKATDLPGMLNSAFQIAISLGAILAMLRIGFAGYLYMGSDMFTDKTHAKEVFRDAIIGLLLLLAIWLILYQINPDILTLSGLKSS